MRQFSGALPSACAPLPLLLLGISGHEATSSQRKLEVQSSRFLLVSQTQFPLLLHMSKLPFRPADVFPPSHLQPDADVSSCNPWREIRREKLQSLEEEALGERVRGRFQNSS